MAVRANIPWFCVTLLTAIGFMAESEWLSTWIAAVVLGIGAALILILSLVLAGGRYHVYPKKTAFRLALVLWFYLLVSEEIFDRAGGVEVEGHFSLVVYGEISLWICAGALLFVLLFGSRNYSLSVLSRGSTLTFVSRVFVPSPLSIRHSRSFQAHGLQSSFWSLQ